MTSRWFRSLPRSSTKEVMNKCGYLSLYTTFARHARWRNDVLHIRHETWRVSTGSIVANGENSDRALSSHYHLEMPLLLKVFINWGCWQDANLLTAVFSNIYAITHFVDFKIVFGSQEDFLRNSFNLEVRLIMSWAHTYAEWNSRGSGIYVHTNLPHLVPILVKAVDNTEIPWYRNVQPMSMWLKPGIDRIDDSYLSITVKVWDSAILLNVSACWHCSNRMPCQKEQQERLDNDHCECCGMKKQRGM